MISPATARLLSFTCLLTISAAAVFTVPRPSVAQEQTPPEDSSLDPSLAPDDDLNDLRPLSQDGSLLSIQGGQRLMEEATNAAASQNYDLAVEKLQQARQVFNQLSNFYQDLASSFSGIDNRIADSQRRYALDTAQMRDQATYQLALVHRAQNQPELAVPLLVQIIRSQQPTRDLGQRAYRQLFELGFVDAPFPRDQESEPTSAAPLR